MPQIPDTRGATLVLQRGALGDTVLALSLVQAFADWEPDRPIYLATTHDIGAVFHQHTIVAACLGIDPNLLGNPPPVVAARIPPF